MDELNITYKEFNPTTEEKEHIEKIILKNKLHGPGLRTIVSSNPDSYSIYYGSDTPYEGGSGAEYTLDKKTNSLELNYTEDLAPVPDDLFKE